MTAGAVGVPVDTPKTILTKSEVRKLGGRPTLSPTEVERRFWSRVDKSAGDDTCWPWTAAKLPNGYGAAWREGRSQKAHRVAWELTFGSIPAGSLICHHCDNRLCCNPSHLYAGSHWDNTQDMVRRGRHNRDGKAHLTPSQVLEIRRRHALGGVTLQQLGDEFGVTDVCIHFVVTRKTWRHLAPVTAEGKAA